MAQRAVGASDERSSAVRDLLAELLAMDEPRKHVAGMISGLDIRYDLGDGHLLIGRRMPDLQLTTAHGDVRVFALLHDARPVLLDLGEPGGFDSSQWGDRVRLVDAAYGGVWELPVLGDRADTTGWACRVDG